MNAVKSDVEKLVQKELESANQKFPLFRSNHEGAAMIVEEIEESRDDLESVERDFKLLWSGIKEHGDYGYCVKNMRYHAVNLACEAIQVASMAQKFIDSQKEREKSEGN